jgi:two-component system phosphate regulon sensor histidine kinase PhoR
MEPEVNFPKIGFAKRLLAIYGVIFIFVLLVTDWTLSTVLQRRDLQQLLSSLVRQSVLIREIASPLLRDTSRLRSEIRKIAEETGLRITVVDPEGVILADSSETDEALPKMDNHATRPEIAAALRKETGMSLRYSITVKAKMLYLATPVTENGKILGVVRVAMPVTHVDEILASVRRPMMFAAFLGILIVLVAGIFFSDHLTKRIRRITSIAERYAREDWSEKILMDGQDELKMLAETMNQMASSLASRIEDLETEKGKISVILGHMKEGVIAIDRRKQLVTANPAAENIFGFAVPEAQGKGLIEITHHPQLEGIVDRAFKEQKTAAVEIQLSGKIKKTLHVNVIVLEAHVRSIGGILVFHDMTELRRLENIRKEFVANVSHELRTPLTSIKGFIETLLGGALKDAPTSERFLKIISEETDRLGRLVEDILTLGEIEQGVAPLRKEAIDLSPELLTILEKLKTQIREKKITVENLLSGKPLRLFGDRDKVHQVLMNLIDNAIKFNKPEGRIILSADQNPSGVTITIEDTGAGIPGEARERIFERFFRVDKARSKELGGTGLGLAIVKHIMEAHGGHASCQSIPGQGSRFSVFFPA